MQILRRMSQLAYGWYGEDVKQGSKAITIKPWNNRRKADVIPAIEYRRYYKFNGMFDQSYATGICFWDQSKTQIANYPKQHSANMTFKHQTTNLWLKPMVGILKNMRTKMIEEGYIKAGSAPSYYIEGLLYNVPQDKFGKSYADSFRNAFSWIVAADTSKFVCANEQYYLLWNDTPTSWSVSDGNGLIDAAVRFWNDWE